MKNVHSSRFVLVGLLLVALMTMAGVSVSAQSAEPACEGEYLESVREIGLTYIAALNAEDLDPWYALLADDYETYQIGSMVPITDKVAARAAAEGIMAVFPGFQTEMHMSTVSSDCRFVTFLWTSSGTFGGPLGEIEPTGQETSVSGISVTEVVDGKITREWVSYDQLTLLAKLGLVTIAAPALE